MPIAHSIEALERLAKDLGEYAMSYSHSNIVYDKQSMYYLMFARMDIETAIYKIRKYLEIKEEKIRSELYELNLSEEDKAKLINTINTKD